MTEGPSPFASEGVTNALNAPLDKKLTAKRDAGRGKQLTYLEGHTAIAQLNRIFSYDGWGYTLDAQGVDEYTEGPEKDWYAQFWAVVTLTVNGAPPRQDVGAMEVQNREWEDRKTGEIKVNNNVRSVDARSTARKGAVTDALKRAARTFGQQFGNGLYDPDNDVYAWMVTHGIDDTTSGDTGVSAAPAPVVVKSILAAAITEELTLYQKLERGLKSAATPEALDAASAAVTTNKESLDKNTLSALAKVWGERKKELEKGAPAS